MNAKNKKCNHMFIQECPHRQLAARICDVFEDLLDKHGIDVPDEDRTGDPKAGEARLYGAAWYDTEDAVMNILLEYAPKIEGNALEGTEDLTVGGKRKKRRKK